MEGVESNQNRPNSKNPSEMDGESSSSTGGKEKAPVRDHRRGELDSGRLKETVTDLVRQALAAERKVALKEQRSASDGGPSASTAVEP